MHGGALVVLAMLAATPPVLAASARASNTSRMAARASLDFRIVIPETIRMRSREDRDGRIRRMVGKSVEVRADRIVVTVSKP